MISEEAGFGRLEYGSMKRTSGKETALRPELHIKEKEIADEGVENDIFDAIIDHEKMEGLRGFVYRQFKDSPDLTPEQSSELLNHILAQWNLIKQINRKLRVEGKKGFSIPRTIRGVLGDHTAGILMNDLSEGGTKDVFDVKDIGKHRDRITPEIWSQIRDTVLSNVELAASHSLRLVSGDSGVDPWKVIIDKKSGACEVVLCDIGRFTGIIPETVPEDIAKAKFDID